MYYLFQLKFISVFSFFFNKNKTSPTVITIKNKALKPTLYVMWTIDVEGGYVKNNGERIWMRNDSKASQGFIQGFSLWQKLFKQYHIPATFFISSQGFFLKPSMFKKLILQALTCGHEIGYHLHLAEDKILQHILQFYDYKNSSTFYTTDQIDYVFKTIRTVLKKYLGKHIHKNIVSFRWGNWGILSSSVFPLLKKYGFTIDSSALPGKKGHLKDDRIFDWSTYHSKKFSQYIGGVREFPTTTFAVFNVVLSADPTYGNLLKKFIQNQLSAVKKDQQSRAIVLISHSSEIVSQNNHKSYLYALVEDICSTLIHKNIIYLTMQEMSETITQ